MNLVRLGVNKPNSKTLNQKKCQNTFSKDNKIASPMSQAARWITTLPSLKMQTISYTTLSTVHWSALNMQNRLVVLSFGVGTTSTSFATQRLPTQGEEQHLELGHLEQWLADQEQATISLLEI